jgi:hypothetical protein
MPPRVRETRRTWWGARSARRGAGPCQRNHRPLRKEDRVGAEPAEELPEQRGLRSPEHAAEGGVGDDRQPVRDRGQLVEQREAHEHRRDHDAAHAGPPREVELPHDPVRRTDEVRNVERRAADVAGRVVHGAEARFDPRLERAERMVGETVVVLHQIDPGAGEGAA